MIAMMQVMEQNKNVGNEDKSSRSNSIKSAAKSAAKSTAKTTGKLAAGLGILGSGLYAAQKVHS